MLMGRRRYPSCQNCYNPKMKSLSCLVLLLVAFPAMAQVSAAKPPLPELRKTFQLIDSRHDSILALWRRLALISAPSGHESERANAILDQLKKSGHPEAFRDRAGNVLSAPVPSGSGAIVFAAHMDTVVQSGVQVAIRDGRNEHGPTLEGPGSGDDVSGVVALLATADALHQAGFKPKRPVVYLFTVNEEKDGTGSEEFFKDHGKDISGYVGVDSSPIDSLGAIADYGTGFFRIEVTFSGPGVHTIESFGVPSTTHGMAIAIENLYKFQRELPQEPVDRRCWLNIGLVKAGTVSNAMAPTAYFSVDLRSNNEALGRELQKKAIAIIEDAAKQAGVQVKVDPRVFAPVRLDTPQARRFRAVIEESYRELGIKPYTGYIGASDYIRALMAGVPGVGIGATNITKMHSPEEISEIEPIYLGIKSVIAAAVKLGNE